jgi:hypothetical protein
MLAAFRQELHLAACPDLPSHLCRKQRIDCANAANFSQNRRILSSSGVTRALIEIQIAPGDDRERTMRKM